MNLSAPFIERASRDHTLLTLAALPLARVAAAVKAGDNVDSPVHDPKEQRIWKTPAACAADISIDHRELLWRGS